jgi:hypothetical protein
MRENHTRGGVQIPFPEAIPADDNHSDPYAARVAAEGIVHVRRGRPKKGAETGPTEPRSIRFPAPMWKLLEERAKAQGLTLHSALRAAIIEWVRHAS